MRRLVSMALACALAALGTAQQKDSGGVLRDDQGCFDVQHYGLTLRIDPEQQSIEGTLLMRALVTEKTELISLDLDPALSVRRVSVGEKVVESTHEDGRIAIPLPRAYEKGATLEVTVAYGGKPHVARRPPWQGGFTWSKTPSGAHWIATSCQGQGADLWWPCKDHPSDEANTVDLKITVPGGLVVASNGTLARVETDEDLATYHWQVRNPINNYGIALNIAPYARLERGFTSTDGTKFPVHFFVLPENAEQGAKFMDEVIDHLRHMESICGPYPFRNEKYGVVETPHLGMEHQTIIAYGNKFRQTGPYPYDWLHHHEMCHEWWANLVTCRDWKDMWIHEGIGTYMQALYLEQRYDEKALRQFLTQHGRHMHRKAVAPRETQSTVQIYFSLSGNDIYDKGAWICHTLRTLLGDETFFKALRRWAYPTEEWEKRLDGTQCRFTDTDEIREIAERVSGRELAWFFDAWVHEARPPVLTSSLDDGTLNLAWSSPAKVTIDMPIEVEVGGKLLRVQFENGRASVPVGAQNWRIDPYDRVLRRHEGPKYQKN